MLIGLVRFLQDQVSYINFVYFIDFGVPETAIGILRVLREVRREKTPCVVHCSAGVGMFSY